MTRPWTVEEIHSLSTRDDPVWRHSFAQVGGWFGDMLLAFERGAAMESIRLNEHEDGCIARLFDARQIAWNAYRALNPDAAKIREDAPYPGSLLAVELRRHLAPDQAARRTLNDLWFHRVLETDAPDFKVATTGLPALNQEQLDDVVADYLARPWLRMHYIEWCLIDALVYREIMAFLSSRESRERYESLFRSKGGRFLARLKWVGRPLDYLFSFFIPLAWIYSLYVAGSATASFWAFAYGVSILCFYINKRAAVRDTAVVVQAAQTDAALIASMFRAYRTVGSLPSSPRKIWEDLQSAETLGAGWGTAVYALLDNAMTTPGGTWNIWKGNQFVSL